MREDKAAKIDRNNRKNPKNKKQNSESDDAFCERRPAYFIFGVHTRSKAVHT